MIQDSVSLPAGDRTIEKRLSLQQFVKATRKALRHCAGEELVQTLREANISQCGQPGRVPKPCQNAAALGKIRNNGQEKTTSQRRTSAPRRRSGRDCEHFAFESKKRREIVEHFLSARARGQVANKDAWAQANYNISGRTLLRYEQEYLETSADTQP